MAKEISSIEIVIRGTPTGPTEVFRRYMVRDSVNTELTVSRTMKVATPDYNKTLHDAGTTGEFWKDEVAAAEADEGI